MITLPGQLAIKTIHGRNGDFNVGQLTTSIGKFAVKDATLDQYKEGKYDGDFIINLICSSVYSPPGRTVFETRAYLGGMTLSGINALSGDEARQLTPQEVDPIDEEAPVSAPATPKAAGQAKPRGPRHPLVDTTPSGQPTGQVRTEASSNDADASLFGTLWPLEAIVKLDSVGDRRVLREQCSRLRKLGYVFAPLSQEWHLAT